MRWITNYRWIPEIDEERARQRFTLSYRFHARLQAGFELDPLADDLNVIGNLTALTETERRPALILGTSSDRIGTDHGQAYYGTLSKSLEPWLDLPIAPYAGVAYGTFDDEFVFVGGLNYWLFDHRLSVTHIWDGENLHLTLDFPWKRYVLGLILAQQEDPDPGEGKDYFLGVSVGARLPGLPGLHGW